MEQQEVQGQEQPVSQEVQAQEAGPKQFEIKTEGTELLIEVDPNKNGKPVLTVRVDLGEAFNEVIGKLGK